jgi:hypothetical protein
MRRIRGLRTAAHVFSLLIIIASIDAYVIPTTQPLQYITAPVAAQYLLESTTSTIWEAVFPETMDDALAVAISEGASGFLGGIAGKTMSIVDGNQNNRDNALTSAGASGAFFAVRGGVRVLADLIGMSTPLVDLSALIVATVLSELIKLRGRYISDQQTRVGNGPTMLELMRFRNPSMKDLMQFQRYEKTGELSPRRKRVMGKVTREELLADIAKWVTYDVVVPGAAYVPWDSTASSGALAGIVAQLFRESDRAKGLQDNVAMRLGRSSIEGAVQFLTYEVSRQYLLSVVPDPERFLTHFSETASALFLMNP